MKKIKILFLRVGILILKIIYAIMKCFKTKNKVTFISRQSNEPSIDFELLKAGLIKECPDVKIVILSKKITNKILYMFHMLKQMYHIATSKVVILDSYCICVSLLNHKKILKVIQIWHAVRKYEKIWIRNDRKTRRSRPRNCKNNENA